MSSNIAADFLGALVRGDDNRCDRLLQEMAAKETTTEFFGAVFYVLARRRFHSDAAHGDIIRFVAALRMEFDHTGDEIDPAAAERLIHAAVDIDPVDPGLEPRVTVELELLLIWGLLQDAALSDVQLTDLFGVADAYLDRVAAPDEFQRSVDRIVAAQRRWGD